MELESICSYLCVKSKAADLEEHSRRQTLLMTDWLESVEGARPAELFSGCLSRPSLWKLRLASPLNSSWTWSQCALYCYVCSCSRLKTCWFKACKHGKLKNHSHHMSIHKYYTPRLAIQIKFQHNFSDKTAVNSFNLVHNYPKKLHETTKVLRLL